MNQSELNETINASTEKVWEVLFSQYGDIQIHNPTMTASSYMHGASEGASDVVRHCEFGKKLYLDEQITDVDEHKSFRVEVVEHNLPFVRDMSATYELSSTDDETTELRMVSSQLVRPRIHEVPDAGTAEKERRQTPLRPEVLHRDREDSRPRQLRQSLR